MRPLITLLTDFGTADGYVAEMKGVLLSLVGEITLVDVSHALAPQDVMSARFVLERYWRRYPAGTVHVVVVDPEVGSSRAALAVAADHRFLLGPDNGVLSAALVVPGAKVGPPSRAGRCVLDLPRQGRVRSRLPRHWPSARRSSSLAIRCRTR